MMALNRRIGCPLVAIFLIQKGAGLIVGTERDGRQVTQLSRREVLGMRPAMALVAAGVQVRVRETSSIWMAQS